jgi:cell volume regulation protein A
VLDVSWLEGFLLGSILASTDGAAVFAVLRGSTLRRRLARSLEGRPG